ncbi:MAG: hypothetical protein RBQ78_02470 [Acholeplasmataceae bacterium]|jgi:hypothetical protein|nr:hypothetical protein [Acholeplasmataceae bacterium]
MKSKAYGYGWILKFVLAALLLGVGIYMVFANEVVYTITGVAIVLFSLLRVIPLMKSLQKETLRTINLIEIIFDTLIGIGMIYVAVTRDLSTEPVWASVYRYALTFVFYVRGLVYFNSVVFLGEKTEIPKFWMHIVSLTIGVIIAVVPNFDYGTVGLFLLIIAIIGSIYLGVDGYGGYQKYREYSKSLNAGKEKGISPAAEEQLPSDQKKQKIIEEPEDKRPYVN